MISKGEMEFFAGLIFLLGRKFPPPLYTRYVWIYTYICKYIYCYYNSRKHMVVHLFVE